MQGDATTPVDPGIPVNIPSDTHVVDAQIFAFGVELKARVWRLSPPSRPRPPMCEHLGDGQATLGQRSLRSLCGTQWKICNE